MNGTNTKTNEDIAEHMMEHGSLYGTDVIKGVLRKRDVVKF